MADSAPKEAEPSPKPPPTYQSASKVPTPDYTAATSTTTATAKGESSKTKDEEAPLAPTDTHPGDDPKTLEFRRWARQRLYANDNFGGHKGVATGPANDPFKVFRWVGRKVRGVSTEGGRSKKWDTSERKEGEVVPGDMESQRIA